MMRWWEQFPSRTCQAFGCARAPHGDAVDLFNFGTFKEPGEPDIDQRSAGNHGDEYHELDKKGRVEGIQVGIVIDREAPRAHQETTHGDLSERSEDGKTAKRSVTQAEHGEQGEEIKEGGKRCCECRAAVLKALEEDLQEQNIEKDIQEKRNDTDDDRRLGVLGGIERWND